VNTYCYAFCKAQALPSAREILTTLRKQGFLLGVHPESFADETEADLFDPDRREWQVMVLGKPDETVVMSLWLHNQDMSYFHATIDAFWERVTRKAEGAGKQLVQHFLRNATFIVEFRPDLRDPDLWLSQEAVMNFFSYQCEGILYLDWDDAFVRRIGVTLLEL
jgi:hypothetical protein